MLRRLDGKTLVSGQIRPEDVPQLAADGVRLIINNRPDGEDADQPLGADIEAAAKAAGISYRHIPIIRGPGPSDVEAMREVLREQGDGEILAFCRSGNRSALTWAIACSHEGVPRQQIEENAAAAGFDLGPVAHLL